MDEAARIFVAAEPDESAPGAHWLLPMIEAVDDDSGELPQPALADPIHRSEDKRKNAAIDLVGASGREGKEHAEVDAAQYPRTVAMAAQLKPERGQQACRKRSSTPTVCRPASHGYDCRAGGESVMPRRTLTQRLLVALAALVPVIVLTAAPLPAAAQVASPHAIDIPRWFTDSFLEFKEEVAEAARADKRVLLYFGQDGCPYCKALMQANFGTTPAAQKITAKTRQHFVAVAINIWGDREVQWLDGWRGTEKQLAAKLAVQFTPTLFFLETDGRVVLRLNGYQPPERFVHIVDWVADRHDRRESLAEYMARLDTSAAALPAPSGTYLMRDPSALARRPGGKPLAVLFESERCAPCAEMHREAFQRPTLKTLLARFDIARIVPGRPARLTSPAGATVDSRAFARDLQIALHPTVVFFDDGGREVFRFDGYMRPFHIESAFDYVASGAYRREPRFQRYVQERAEALRAAGKPVDLWR